VTPAELAVERDWLLEHGRTVEEVEAMQRNADGETERLLEWWAEYEDRPWTDHACAECLRGFAEQPLVAPGWRCLWHRAMALRVARLEREAIDDAPDPRGEFVELGD